MMIKRGAWAGYCAVAVSWWMTACSDPAPKREPEVTGGPSDVCEDDSPARDTVSIHAVEDSVLAPSTGVTVKGWARETDPSTPIEVTVEELCIDLPKKWKPVSKPYRFTVAGPGAGDCATGVLPLIAEPSGPVRVLERNPLAIDWPNRNEAGEHIGGVAMDTLAFAACSRTRAPTDVIAVEFCPVGYELCSQRCRAVETDASHCGVCGNVCNAGELCVRGECGGGTTVAAPAGMTVGEIALDGGDLFVRLTSESDSQVGVLRAGTQIIETMVTTDAYVGALAAGSGFVYWHEQRLASASSALMRMRSDGSDITTLEEKANGASMESIAVDGDDVYYASGDPNDYAIFRRSANGSGDAERLTDAMLIRDMIVRGDALYYSENMSIRRLPLAGGAPQPLGRAGTTGFALDDQHVYYAHLALERQPLDGSDATVLTYGYEYGLSPTHVALFGDTVYFTDVRTGVYELKKEGDHDPTPIAKFDDPMADQNGGVYFGQPFIVTEDTIFLPLRFGVAVLPR